MANKNRSQFSVLVSNLLHIVTICLTIKTRFHFMFMSQAICFLLFLQNLTLSESCLRLK